MESRPPNRSNQTCGYFSRQPSAARIDRHQGAVAIHGMCGGRYELEPVEETQLMRADQRLSDEGRRRRVEEFHAAIIRLKMGPCDAPHGPALEASRECRLLRARRCGGPVAGVT
jgi:hypothetical protein